MESDLLWKSEGCQGVSSVFAEESTITNRCRRSTSKPHVLPTLKLDKSDSWRDHWNGEGFAAKATGSALTRPMIAF